MYERTGANPHHEAISAIGLKRIQKIRINRDNNQSQKDLGRRSEMDSATTSATARCPLILKRQEHHHPFFQGS